MIVIRKHLKVDEKLMWHDEGERDLKMTMMSATSAMRAAVEVVNFVCYSGKKNVEDTAVVSDI